MPGDFKPFFEMFLILLGLGVLLAGVRMAGRALQNRRRRQATRAKSTKGGN